MAKSKAQYGIPFFKVFKARKKQPLTPANKHGLAPRPKGSAVDYRGRGKDPEKVDRHFRWIERELRKLFKSPVYIPEPSKVWSQDFVERDKLRPVVKQMPAKGFQVPEDKDLAHPRTRIFERLTEFKVEWQNQGSGRRQGIENFNRITLRETGLETWYMFFSGRRYLVVRDDLVRMRMSVSVVYNSRERLYDAFQRERLVWAGHDSLDTESTD